MEEKTNLKILKHKLDNAKNNTDIIEVLNEYSMLIKNLEIKIKEKENVDIDTSKTLQKLKNLRYCQALIVTIEKLLKKSITMWLKSY